VVEGREKEGEGGWGRDILGDEVDLAIGGPVGHHTLHRIVLA